MSSSCDKHFGLLIQLQTFRELPYACRTGHGARTETQGLILQTCLVSSLGTALGCGKKAHGFCHTQPLCWAGFCLHAKLASRKIWCSAPLKEVLPETPRGLIFLYAFFVHPSVAGRGLLGICLGTLESSPVCTCKMALKMWPKTQICMLAV